jgi:hypothetical protein
MEDQAAWDKSLLKRIKGGLIWFLPEVMIYLGTLDKSLSSVYRFFYKGMKT